MKKNKTVAIVLGIFALVIVTTGASFAFFQYQRTGNTKVNVTSGDITFSYMEDNQDANLVNAFPVADSVGAVDITGEYEFTVNLKSSSGASGTYNVILVGNNNESKNYFTNDQIKFSLVKNNTYVAGTSATVGKKLSSVTGFTSTLTSGEGAVLKNQRINAGQTDTYKLRIWISDDVNYSNAITNGTSIGKYNGYTYSLKVKVTSGIENNYGKPEIVNPGMAVDSIMSYAETETGSKELRIDNHEATGQQDFAATEYRYYGKNPNNYVTFNNELWRIIGVFDVDDGEGNAEKRIKIIRAQPILNRPWNNSWNEWKTSLLNTYLNGEYFTSLSNTARSMIGTSVYYLGANETVAVPSNIMYISERGTTVYEGHSTKIASKIALMYPSDYGYAAGTACDTTNLNSYSLSCQNMNWLYSATQQWFLTPHLSGASVFHLNYFDGNITYGTISANHNASPVMYLLSNIEIETGIGTSSDPFILK